MQENLDMAKKAKHQERNWMSSDSSTKQHHKDYVKAKIVKTPKKLQMYIMWWQRWNDQIYNKRTR